MTPAALALALLLATPRPAFDVRRLEPYFQQGRWEELRLSDGCYRAFIDVWHQEALDTVSAAEGGECPNFFVHPMRSGTVPRADDDQTRRIAQGLTD